MRIATLLGCLAVAALLGLAEAARADDAVTIEKETDARCGRGDGTMFYPTNHLKPGDRVRVLKEEEGGWLAILPPSGSFSWINKQLLYHRADWPANTWTVNAPEAPVRIGSNLSPTPPTVIGLTLKRGAIVTTITGGHEQVDQEGTWLPIDPPKGDFPRCEVRYIRAETIQKPAAGAAGVFAASPNANPTAPGDAEVLYKQAIAAEKWNPQQAITLYDQGANSDANPDRRLQALNRANWLRENLKNPTTSIMPGVPPGGDLRMAAAPSESKVYPLASSPQPNPDVRLAPPQGSGAPTTNSWSATPTALRTSPAPAGPPTAGTEYSSGPGWLQVSGRSAEGRKTYVMVSDKGVPFYYATNQPGVNLELYLKRRVELFGQAIYNGDLRANYMRVSRIEMREGQ
ncbi:MAG TPA: hypothetical protein DDY78_14295 [Planctomycetales bacterium]|jgi:hypothetical protein|nr:hypothetical protein [Planctomycetales bacterium]